MKKINLVKKAKGFTLIEVLVVIGIIAILAAIVVIAINPAKQFAQARNTQRQAGVNSILNAVGQRIADNRGRFADSFRVNGTDYFCPPLPSAAAGVATAHINTTALTATTTTASGDLGCLVPTYIASLPIDPNSDYSISPYTGYDIGVDPTGRVTVCASQGNEASVPGSGPICVTR